MNLYVDTYAQRDKTMKYIHAYLHFPVTVRNQERKKKSASEENEVVSIS